MTLKNNTFWSSFILSLAESNDYHCTGMRATRFLLLNRRKTKSKDVQAIRYLCQKRNTQWCEISNFRVADSLEWFPISFCYNRLYELLTNSFMKPLNFIQSISHVSLLSIVVNQFLVAFCILLSDILLYFASHFFHFLCCICVLFFND